jgi:hypothetical protein
VTPEASRFLDKARKLLEHVTTMLSVSLNEDAGRTAYLAGFHAAMSFTCNSPGAGPNANLSIPILCTCGSNTTRETRARQSRLPAPPVSLIFARFGMGAYFSSLTRCSACF